MVVRVDKDDELPTVQISDNLKNMQATMRYFTYSRWKAAVKLEIKGLRHSRGSVAQNIRDNLKLKKNVGRVVLVKILEKLMAEELEARK